LAGSQDGVGVVRASRYRVVAVSTSESFAMQRPPQVLRVVDDREFAVVPMGYDREQVKAHLGEVEASFRELERWAEEAKARLKIVSSAAGRTHIRTDRPSAARGLLIGARRDPQLRITARPEAAAASKPLILSTGNLERHPQRRAYAGRG
jgi:hypothetical protein